MNSVKNYGSMSKTTMCNSVTLTFDQWPWIKVGHFLGSSVTILWNIIPIHSFSENLWPRQCLNHYEHSDLDLWQITLGQSHDTSLGPGQQACEILFKFIKRVRSYGPDKLFAKVLTIMSIVTLTFDLTLDQGHDTSLGPGQQSCEILFKCTKRIRSYGLDKLGRTQDGQRHNIIRPAWRWAYKK
jgi:hypothetical protein